MPIDIRNEPSAQLTGRGYYVGPLGLAVQSSQSQQQQGELANVQMQRQDRNQGMNAIARLGSQYIAYGMQAEQQAQRDIIQQANAVTQQQNRIDLQDNAHWNALESSAFDTQSKYDTSLRNQTGGLGVAELQQQAAQQGTSFQDAFVGATTAFQQKQMTAQKESEGYYHGYSQTDGQQIDALDNQISTVKGDQSLPPGTKSAMIQKMEDMKGQYQKGWHLDPTAIGAPPKPPAIDGHNPGAVWQVGDEMVVYDPNTLKATSLGGKVPEPMPDPQSRRDRFDRSSLFDEKGREWQVKSDGSKDKLVGDNGLDRMKANGFFSIYKDMGSDLLNRKDEDGNPMDISGGDLANVDQYMGHMGIAFDRYMGGGSARPSGPQGPYEPPPSPYYGPPDNLDQGSRVGGPLEGAQPAIQRSIYDSLRNVQAGLGAPPNAGVRAEANRQGREIQAAYEKLPPIAQRLLKPIVSQYITATTKNIDPTKLEKLKTLAREGNPDAIQALLEIQAEN